MATMLTIRILVAIFLIKIAGCQDGFSEQDYLRLQQYVANDGQTEAITSFSTNLLQREPNPVNVQYHYNNENSDDYNSRIDRGRSRKVYRIKNPFQQQQQEDDKSSQENSNTQDSATGASNQYAAMQYSLPPEDFLQKMRAENQYQQQQQQQQQLSTQVSVTPYTATPQPQYQYSTIPASNYDLNQQSSQLSTSEPRVYSPTYQSNSNAFQYNPYVYNTDAPQSTPIPPYLTTPQPNTQYLGTPANTYVSSSSPLYLSSPPSLQQYVSSPFSNIQSGTVDYSNNRVTTTGSNYDTNNELNKAMQIDHYDNAANGVRYPTHMQNQYQTDFPSSTVSPNSSMYPDAMRTSWQGPLSPSNYNALPKSEQGYSQQYQNLRYNGNQRDNRQESNIDSSNSETHRIGSMPSANNLFFNYVQPEYQFYNNLKNQARDSDSDSSQSDVYSHGDYGWRLSDKKSSLEPEIATKNNYFKYQIQNTQPETGVFSQVSFQMDSSKPYGYEQNTKPVSEKTEAEEFARAAARAHEKYKQQLESSKYLSNNNYNDNLLSNSFGLSSFYNNDNDRKRSKYSENSNLHGNVQSDVVSASSFPYINSREVADSRQKLPFDHDKALKNIVPMDVSNVVQNSDSSVKSSSNSDLNNRYSNIAYHKDSMEQNQKQFSRQVIDPYYKDKNTLYTIKSKPDDFLDKMKQMEQNVPYYGKHQGPETFYNNNPESGNKRFVDELTQSLSFANQVASNHQDNAQSSANINQQGMQQRPQTTSDIANLLKFNDIPYRLTQNLNLDFQRMRNNALDQTNIPTPLPLRINQNVDNHHIDVAAELFNKLMSNKPQNSNTNRPEVDPHTGNLISTINGFKVANPFNVDLKLVADMLKGKTAVDDSQMISLRGDLNKPLPMKLDISQLQQLLALKNENNALNLNNGLNSFSNPFYDIYSSGRFPYQGVKYSRSEEEPETIPIADSSNNHLIGAISEGDDISGDLSDVEFNEENESPSVHEERAKKNINSSHKSPGDKHKHLNLTYSNRYNYKRKYPKSDFAEPYPLLKPPPPHTSRHRTSSYKGDKMYHRRRLGKPKMLRIFKTEPLYEAGTSMDDLDRSITVAEDRSDNNSQEKTV